MSDFIDNFLNKHYYDVSAKSSFSAPKHLYNKLKNIDPLIKYKDIINWLLKQKTYTIHRSIRKHFNRNPIVSKHIDHIWNADLLETPYPSKNKNYRYILMVIDNLSKYGWAKKLKNKQSNTVKKAFLEIFRDSKRKPIILCTDAGTEFTNRIFKKYLKYRKIKHLILRDQSKAVLAERLIRTIKEKIFKYLSYNKTKKFIDVLDNIVENYNNTLHSGTKFSPKAVTKLNQLDAYRNLYKMRTTQEKNTFNLGDEVRLALIRGPFAKGYLPNYTKEIFVVYEIYFTSPFYKYRVRDRKGNIIRGSFYKHELIKVSV